MPLLRRRGPRPDRLRRLDATSRPPTATSSGPPEPVEIRFSWWGSDTRHELTQQVLDKFTEKYPHITVVPDYTDWNSYFDKLGTVGRRR